MATDFPDLIAGGTIEADHINGILENAARFPTVEAVITTVTSASETIVKQQAVAANQVVVGRVFIIRLAGVYTTTGSETWTIRLRLSSTVWHTFVTTVGAVTNAPWFLEWVIIIPTQGSSGKASARALARLNATTTLLVPTAEQDWNTTISRVLEITAQASSGSGQSFSCRQFSVESHGYL